MSDNFGPANRRRRRLLKALATAGATVTIAGCGGDDDATATATDELGDATATATDELGDATATPTPAGLDEGPGDNQFIEGYTTPAGSTLSPLSVGDEATINFLDLMYDPPGTIDDDPIEFQGRLLENWELSDDAQTVSYTVRDGLEWGADYGQVTAEDFVYCGNSVFSQSWAQHSQVSYFYLNGEPIEFEQTGELTFEASLPVSRANWLHEDPMIYSYPIPKDLAQQYNPNDSGTPNVTATGTAEFSPREALDRDPVIAEHQINGNLGPFNFVEYEAGNSLTVEANPDYYLAETDIEEGAFEGAPMTDTYQVQIFDEASTGYSALQAGDITTIGIESRQYDNITSPDDVKKWHSQYGTGIFWLNLNHRVNGWAPIRESRQVRQAFAHLISRQTLIDQIFDGYANSVDTFHPRWGPYYNDDQIEVYETDIEQAKTKFAEGTGSDYSYDGDMLVGPDGSQVELTLVIDNTSQTGQIVGNYLTQQFSQAGISLTTEGLPFGDILQTYLANSVSNNPNYDGEPDYGPVSGYNGGPWDQAISAEPWDILYGVGFSHGAYAPWQSISGVLTRTGAFNYLGYQADDYDLEGALNDAATASSQEEVNQILSELFGFLSRDQPLTWLFNDHSTLGYRDHISGLPEVQNAFTEPNARLLSLGGQ